MDLQKSTENHFRLSQYRFKEEEVCSLLESLGHTVYGSFREGNKIQIDVVSKYEGDIFLHEVKYRSTKTLDIHEVWNENQFKRHRRHVFRIFDRPKYWLWIGHWNSWKSIGILF